ncbi:Ty3/gypsy retrotransposon protein, partial [Trifolium medium]|nr:Ty3/gypsy retrotransposon protein [Trifolium medium]
MQGTQLKMSTTYHPESDGQTEVVSRCLETYLRCKTPFEIVYGRLPPVLTRWLQGETKVEAVQRDLVDRDEAIRQLKAQLMRAQEKMKSQDDKKRTDRSFMVGKWVFVKLSAHRQ